MLNAVKTINLHPEQKVYAPTHDLVAAVDSIEPSVLIGVSTVGKAFTRAVVD